MRLLGLRISPFDDDIRTGRPSFVSPLDFLCSLRVRRERGQWFHEIGYVYPTRHNALFKKRRRWGGRRGGKEKETRRVLRPLELASASLRIAGPVYHRAIVPGASPFELWVRCMPRFTISFPATVIHGSSPSDLSREDHLLEGSRRSYLRQVHVFFFFIMPNKRRIH